MPGGHSGSPVFSRAARQTETDDEFIRIRLKALDIRDNFKRSAGLM